MERLTDATAAIEAAQGVRRGALVAPIAVTAPWKSTPLLDEDRRGYTPNQLVRYPLRRRWLTFNFRRSRMCDHPWLLARWKLAPGPRSFGNRGSL